MLTRVFGEDIHGGKATISDDPTLKFWPTLYFLRLKNVKIPKIKASTKIIGIIIGESTIDLTLVKSVVWGSGNELGAPYIITGWGARAKAFE